MAAVLGGFGAVLVALVVAATGVVVAGAGAAYTAAALRDEITHLPGAARLRSRHFSGYLVLSPAKMIHYYYIESHNDPDTDSLIYWTNGGPGCSGLIGMFTEMGPWRPTSNSTLEENPFAWTARAGMVFLEQPVGVGFSYTLDGTLSDNFNDFRASVDNLAVIKTFLQRFPQLDRRDFYLSSESYGGHYIPHWTLQVLNDDSDLKNYFRGFLVGNPYTSFASGSIAGINVLWGQQLVPQPVWDYAVAGTCDLLSHDAYFLSTYLPVCFGVIDLLWEFVAALNPYALDFDVCPRGNGIRASKLGRAFSGSSQARALHRAQRRVIQLMADQAAGQEPGVSVDGATAAAATVATEGQAAEIMAQLRDRLRAAAATAAAAALTSQPSSSKSNEDSAQGIEYRPCTEVTTIDYLNNPAVQAALHVDIFDKPRRWQPCSEAVNTHWAANDYLADTTALYSAIFNHAARRKDFKMLVYSGDSDGVCATVGTQFWIYGVENARVLSLFQPWRAEGQQAGLLTQFTGHLSFATVHHAGHEVPAYQPERALVLLERFLNGSLFADYETDSALTGEQSSDSPARSNATAVLSIVLASLIIVAAVVAYGAFVRKRDAGAGPIDASQM